jgi:Tfp pilus assembly protein FimT
MRGSQSGVTLTEAMVVMSVVALATAVALPLVGTAVGDSVARGAAEQVVSAFRAARQHAISAAATYQVTVSGDALAIACTNDSPVGNVCPAVRAPDRSEPVSAGVTLVASASPFAFGPAGAATPGTVTVAYGSVTPWQVAVNATGRVRACLSVCP